MKTNAKKISSAIVRPADNLQDNLTRLYPVIEHWKSDMKFFKDELNFFHSLLDKYLILLISDKNVKKTRILAKKIFSMEPERDRLEKGVTKHLTHLHEVITNPFMYDVHAFNREHEILETDVAKFVSDFRLLKAQTFHMVDHVISSN